MTYANFVLDACIKNNSRNRGASRIAIKKYIEENNKGKYSTGACRRAIAACVAAGTLAQGSTSARFAITDAGRQARKPKK